MRNRVRTANPRTLRVSQKARRLCNSSATARIFLAVQRTFDHLQAETIAFKAKHTAIREANAALLPATLERVFTQ